MEEASAGHFTSSRGGRPSSVNVALKSFQFFSLGPQLSSLNREPRQVHPGCNGSAQFKVNWAETETLLKSKYTRDLTDRHAAAIVKICRQYVACYNGIPYTDIPNLTSIVHHLVAGFQQGECRYGFALRELCNAASKPFVARKASEPLTYQDAAILFTVALCCAAAYDEREHTAGYVTAETAGRGADASHDTPSESKRAQAAVLSGSVCQENSPSTSNWNLGEKADNTGQPANDNGLDSSSRDFPTSVDEMLMNAEACEEDSKSEKECREKPEQRTTSSAKRSQKDTNASHESAQVSRAIARSPRCTINWQTYAASRTTADGEIDGEAVNAPASAQTEECVNNRVTGDDWSTQPKQNKNERIAVTSQPEDESYGAKQEEWATQVDAVRSAVFHFLEALASQWSTLRHASTKSGTKDNKTGSSGTVITRHCRCPFELPAFAPVLKLIKAAFLHPRTTPETRASTMRLLLDLSCYNSVASYLLDSRLLIGLLREAQFDAARAAGFPSGAAYSDFQGKAVETVLNLAECASTEQTTFIQCMTDEEAVDVVGNISALLSQLYRPRTPSEIVHMRNDLLCTLMLLSRHSRLLPLFASSALLQQIIDNSCGAETLSCFSDTIADALKESVLRHLQASGAETGVSQAKCWGDLSTGNEAFRGVEKLACESPLSSKGASLGLQEAESVTLCWATIINCLDDPPCRRVIRNSTFLETVIHFVKAELNLKEAAAKSTGCWHSRSARLRVLFMQALSLLSPALKHLAEDFIDIGGLSLLLQIIERELFPDLMDKFMQLLSHLCLISKAAERACNLLLVDNCSSAVQVLLRCMANAGTASACLPGGALTSGFQAEGKSNFLKNHHCAAFLLAVLCYDSQKARTQFRQLNGPSVLVKQLEVTLNSMRCVCRWTSVAYVICLCECVRTSTTRDPAIMKDYLRASGLPVLLEALKWSPKFLQRHLLGCLTELLSDGEAAQQCRDWKAADTGETAMEMLAVLWEKDHQKFSTMTGDGCIADMWRPLHLQVLGKGSTRADEPSPMDGCLLPTQAKAQASEGAPQNAFRETPERSAETSASKKQECAPESRSHPTAEPVRSLQRALSLAAISRQRKRVSRERCNVLEKAVADYETQDIRLDIFCTIEALTQRFCELKFQLSAKQKLHVELMKVYPSCCELEAWVHVKDSLLGKGIQPIDVDRRWMESEINRLYSIAVCARNTQQAILQTTSEEDREAINAFYDRIMSSKSSEGVIIPRPLISKAISSALTKKSTIAC